MRRELIFILACVCFGTNAWAQCNPSIPGTCGANDPALLGQQQLQENRASQQLEMMKQNQQIQDIQRNNTRRYENQQQQLLQDRGRYGARVPEIVTEPSATLYRSRALHRHHKVRRHAVRPMHRTAPHRSGRRSTMHTRSH